ncbi:conserved hypothetical protein [Xanthomonas citri pv. citri]|nr:conserved hypothetical protein [Xanthomonas citri pv. citri]
MRWCRRRTPARQTRAEQGADHVVSAGVAGAVGIVAATLGVIAAGTGQRQIARIVGIVAHQYAQRRGRAPTEPGLRHHVFERGVAERFAVGAHLQMPTAVQAARLPMAVEQLRLRIGLRRQQQPLAQHRAHAQASMTLSSRPILMNASIA